MKRLFIVSVFTVLLSACVDTTGISPELSSGTHPQTNPNAVVTVVEFGDLQCPSCRAAQEQIVKPMLAKYGQQIRFEFMHFPIQTAHPYAFRAAQAAECSADQGKFWEYVDTVFVNQDKLSKASLTQWAQDLGLDMDLFDRCLRSGIKKDAILAQYQEGKTAGVGGTPTFFVNGQIVESGLPEISAAIEAALKNPGQKL